jgi:hypothetical protein
VFTVADALDLVMDELASLGAGGFSFALVLARTGNGFPGGHEKAPDRRGSAHRVTAAVNMSTRKRRRAAQAGPLRSI